jgi:hypothetical protein
MKRRATVLVALAACTVLAPAALGAGAGSEPTITAAVHPATPLFADSFTYEIAVTADAAAADRVRIAAGIFPFTRVAPTRTTRSHSGGSARITVTETLACLTSDCVPPRAGQAATIPPARVTLDGATVAADRVAVRVGSRVSRAEVKAAQPPFTYPRELPAPTNRVDPATAEVVLAVVGLGLMALGIAILVAPIRRRRSRVDTARVDPVARAARLLRESASRDVPDRRRAASLAAKVVRERDLATDAATVAWSRPEPAPPDATLLAERLERATGSGR